MALANLRYINALNNNNNNNKGMNTYITARTYRNILKHALLFSKNRSGGSVAEWLACWTQSQKGLVSNRSRVAVG